MALTVLLFQGLCWDKIPIEVVWLSSLFKVIGGGPNVAYAMLLTMAADISTPETRYVQP
jgi:hypothetical protein